MPDLNIDLADVTQEDMDAEGGWTAIPTGEYRFVVRTTTYKPTSAGNGMVFGLKLLCVEPGPHTGSKLFDYLTIKHPNADTVRIARAKLKQVAIATGHPTPEFVKRSEDLHDRPFIAKVVCQKADNPKYGDGNGNQNRIIAYRPLSPIAGAGNGSGEGAREEPPPADDIPF